MPKSLVIRYRFHNGSLPPPDHYEYILTLKAPNKGNILFYPDYPSENVQPTEIEFTFEFQKLQELHACLHDFGLLHNNWNRDETKITGGEMRSMEIVAENEIFAIPADSVDVPGLQKIYETVEKFITPETAKIVTAVCPAFRRV